MSHQLPLHACHCCGLIQRLPAIPAGHAVECKRCGTAIHAKRDAQRGSARTAAATLGALMLFFPAVLLPILEVEKLGHRYESSIVTGVIELLRQQEWFVGGVVLLFSIIFPLAKLLLLLELSWLGLLQRKHKALTYRAMESVGKWSMLDVLLLAFMVMLVKIGDLVDFHFGPAVVAFALCVAMSIVASLSFDAHAIWEDAP